MSDPRARGISATSLRFESLRGPAIEPWLERLGALRIRVFREYPYLYEGDAGYEARYLRRYVEASSGFVGIVLDGDRLVGATTCLDLLEEDEAFRAPIERAGHDPSAFSYFGESVLLAEYRGRGVGHRFFDLRESAARAREGIDCACFASVVRAGNDPRRPEGYRPHDAFWSGRGYRPLEGARARFSWREIGEAEETEHELEMWWRRLESNGAKERA